MAERLRTFVEYIVTSKSIPAGAAIVAAAAGGFLLSLAVSRRVVHVS